MESTNGGVTWIQGRGIHVDQHALAWDPHNQDRVYVGNDGGLYWSDQNGNVIGAWSQARVQPYMQFYAMDASAQDVTRTSGGTQDNGSLRSWGGTDWNLYRGWLYIGTDMGVFFSPNSGSNWLKVGESSLGGAKQIGSGRTTPRARHSSEMMTVTGNPNRRCT